MLSKTRQNGNNSCVNKVETVYTRSRYNLERAFGVHKTSVLK